MIDFTKYSVEDLRQAIATSSIPENLKNIGSNLKGKANVAKFIVDNKIPIGNYQPIADEVFLEEENNINNTDQNNTDQNNTDQNNTELPNSVFRNSSPEDFETVPDYNSSDWEPYVMAHMGADGVEENGYPLLIGLKRAASALLGEIIFSGPVELNFGVSPEPHASCIYEVRIKWKNDLLNAGYNNIEKTYRSCADSFSANTDHPFNNFASTIAESRAEARALRKALNLKVVSKEELTEKIKFKAGSGITSQQLIVIKSLSKSLKFKQDIGTYLFGREFAQCSNEEAKKILKQINEYKSDLSTIPAELLN